MPKDGPDGFRAGLGSPAHPRWSRMRNRRRGAPFRVPCCRRRKNGV
ncbi:MAG: hypothetical protein MZV64_33935 [Ignavibacteriales bacterium]|nr:hypothetical protein [Ignavibacteriales bacterium]